MSERQNENSAVKPLARHAGTLLFVAALAAFGALLAYGTTLKVSSPWVIGCLVVGFAALAGWFSGRSQQKSVARDQWAKQRTLMGANSILSTALFLLLLVGVNYVAARRHKTFDLTSNKINSLADQTQKALEKLPGNVTLTYVYDLRQQPQDVALLEKYKFASDKIRVKYVDAAAQPKEFAELNLGASFTGNPLIVVQGEDKKGGRQQVDFVDESNLTSALLKLGDNKTRVLYYLVGHGETSLDSASPQMGFGTARAKLEAQGYRVQSLSLTGPKAKIPDDATALLILGPKDDLAPGEATLLQKYATGKGRLLLALAISDRPLPRWRALAKQCGAQVLDGFIQDPEQFVQRPEFVYGPVIDAGKHPILSGVGENSNVVFPVAVPLKQANLEGATLTTLFESSPSSVAIPTRPGGSAQRGPFALAIAAQSGDGTTMKRSLVIGNATFGVDAFYGQFANGNFFLAAVNWVAGNELLVSIPPKPPVTNSINLTPGTQRFVVLFSMFVLPLAMLFFGGLVWWRRR
jgi:hypothetical protein